MFPIRHNIIAIGDAKVGKTLLLNMQRAEDRGIPLVYEPSVCKYCFPLLHNYIVWL